VIQERGTEGQTYCRRSAPKCSLTIKETLAEREKRDFYAIYEGKRTITIIETAFFQTSTKSPFQHYILYINKGFYEEWNKREERGKVNF